MIENELLNLLDKNARYSVEELAKLLGAKEEEVVMAISKLEKEKAICGYKAIINWDKISEEKVSALIEVKVTPQRGVGFDKIANRIAKYSEVDSIYLLSGDYDFVVLLQGKSMREISQFVFDKLSTLEGVLATATHVVLKKYKDHGCSLEVQESDPRESLLL